MSQNCVFTLVEIRDFEMAKSRLHDACTRMDTAGWIYRQLPLQKTIPFSYNGAPFSGQHFKHYCMKIVLEADEELREPFTAYTRPYSEWIMLVGEANLVKFTQHAVATRWFVRKGASTAERPCVVDFDELVVSIEIIPLLSGSKQRQRESDLLKLLEAQWWFQRSISITGAIDAALALEAEKCIRLPRWKSADVFIADLNSILEGIMTAIRHTEHERAQNACIAGWLLTKYWYDADEDFYLSPEHDDQLEEIKLLFHYYWTKTKLISACALATESSSSTASSDAIASSTANKILDIYDSHESYYFRICGEWPKFDHMESWTCSTEEGRAEIFYDLFNVQCIVGNGHEARRRLIQATDLSPQDFRARQAKSMLATNEFRLLSVTIEGLVLWTSSQSSPVMLRLDSDSREPQYERSVSGRPRKKVHNMIPSRPRLLEEEEEEEED